MEEPPGRVSFRAEDRFRCGPEPKDLLFARSS